MTKDYSGKNLSRKAMRCLLVVNLILLACAVWLLVENIRHDELVFAIGMGFVVVLTLYNSAAFVLRLKGKK